MARRAPSLSTWLTIVARSTARDALRRRRAEAVPIQSAPKRGSRSSRSSPAIRLKLPEAWPSPRQREILAMLYDREMDVAEIARALGIDAQTVRSTHHKAMIKLWAQSRADAQNLSGTMTNGAAGLGSVRPLPRNASRQFS